VEDLREERKNKNSKKVGFCHYCPDHPGFIEDLSTARLMPDGSYKCQTCIDLDLKKRMVDTFGPNDISTYKFVHEEQEKVDKFNSFIEKLNRAGMKPIEKPKNNKYLV